MIFPLNSLIGIIDIKEIDAIILMSAKGNVIMPLVIYRKKIRKEVI